MRYFISQIGTNHQILFLVYFETFVQCFVITPRTVPDDIELFNSSYDHSKDYVIGRVKHDKPWHPFVDANVKNSLSECISRMMKGIVFSQIWQCTLHFSSSYQIIK